MNNVIRREAEVRLRKALMEVFHVPGDTADSWVSLINYPTHTPMAHVAFPCHSLARHLKRAPQAIADALAGNVRSGQEGQLLRNPRAESGYLNFSVDVDALFQCLERSGAQRSGMPTTADKVDVEFSQPNTHKALHVGHLRNMIHGDAVCNLLLATGTRVVRSTFPGDLGAHVAKCLWYVRKYKRGEIPDTADPVLSLDQFPAAVREAAREYRPSVLCTYLFELCRRLNRFYKECPIKSASDPVIRGSRRALVEFVGRTLKEGFGLLGIPCLERL